MTQDLYNDLSMAQETVSNMTATQRLKIATRNKDGNFGVSISTGTGTIVVPVKPTGEIVVSDKKHIYPFISPEIPKNPQGEENAPIDNTNKWLAVKADWAEHLPDYTDQIMKLTDWQCEAITLLSGYIKKATGGSPASVGRGNDVFGGSLDPFSSMSGLANSTDEGEIDYNVVKQWLNALNNNKGSEEAPQAELTLAEIKTAIRNQTKCSMYHYMLDVITDAETENLRPCVTSLTSVNASCANNVLKALKDKYPTTQDIKTDWLLSIGYTGGQANALYNIINGLTDAQVEEILLSCSDTITGVINNDCLFSKLQAKKLKAELAKNEDNAGGEDDGKGKGEEEDERNDGKGDYDKTFLYVAGGVALIGLATAIYYMAK